MGNREKEIMPDIKTYKVDGDVFDIPEDKVQEFLNDFPDAIEVKSFTVDQDTFDIPLNKVGEFTKDFPKAETLTATKEKKRKKEDPFEGFEEGVKSRRIKQVDQEITNIDEQISALHKESYSKEAIERERLSSLLKRDIEWDSERIKKAREVLKKEGFNLPKTREQTEERLQELNTKLHSLRGYYDTENDLRQTKTLLKKSKELLEAPEKGSDEVFIKELWQGLMSPVGKDWASMGMSEIKRGFNIVGILKKADAGEELTEEETRLIETYQVLQDIEQGTQTSSWYNIGKITSEMVPYMAQFALTTPVATAVRSGITGGAKVAAQKGMKAFIKKSISKEGAKMLGGYTVGAMAQTPFMPIGYSDFARRRADQYEITGSEENLQVDLRLDAESTMASVYKAYATAFSEVFSEGAGEWMALGVKSVGKKMTKEMINGGNVNSIIKGIKKATKWNGAIYEWAEENLNMVMQSILTGDQPVKEIFDAGQQWEIFASCSIMGVGFKAAEVPGRIEFRQVRNNYNQSHEKATRLIGEDIVGQVDNIMKDGTVIEIGDELNRIVKENELKPRQQHALAELVANRLRYDSLTGALEEKPEIKVQPPIPKYKIGETEYENKDTFLSEVEKFKGEKDTPKITVTDDQATLDEVDKILEIEEEPSKEVPKKEDEIEAAKITVSIGGIISPLLNEPESHFRGFSREKVIPHIKEAVKKFSDKVEQFFEGTLNLEGIETHEDLMRLVSTSPILRYWKQNAKDQLRIFIKNKADGKETRTVEDFVLSREAEEGKEAPTEEVKEEVTKSIFDQEVDLLEGEKEEAMHVIKAEEQQKVGDIVEFKDSKGDIQEGNFRGIGKDNNAVIEVIAKKDGKTFQNTFLIPVDDVKFPKTFPKEEISKIDYALENNLYQEWIKEGKMTANDAKTIIESATLEVPQDIIDLANKEIKQTERVTVEGKPPPDSPEYPKWVAEESSDVDEIAGAHTRLTEEGEGQVAPWQEGLLGMKVNPKSFADFSDKAHKAFGLAKQWFDVKRDKVQGYDSGFGIDDIAKELSDTYGVDVTPQMVVDFIIDNPSKKTGVQKGLINTLASKYKKLTGGDNIADHGKIIEAENEVLAQDVSALDELFNEDGTINVEVTNDKIDNNPDFFEGFRVNFSQEEITELKNIINNESRRKEFESKIKEIRTLQESIVGETLEPRVKRDEGEVTEEVKEPPLKSEQVKKKGESLLAQFSGIRGYFDVSKQKKKGKQEKQRDELKGFLDQKMQEELNAAETQEEKDAITKDYNKKLKDTERLFSRDKFTAQQRALEVRRKIIKDFIGDNRKDLQRVHGNVVPAMLNSVNSAKTMKQVDHALDYMEGVMKKQKAKEEAILWSNRYDKLQKKLDPTTYADKKATVLKGKKNVTAEMLNKLSNIRNNLFNKTRDEGQQKATDLIDKVVAENRDMTAEEYESLEEYTTYGISEMTAEELGRVNDYIDDIVKGEKTRGYNEYLARKQEELERIEHFGTTIRGGKPKKASIYDDRTKLKPKSKRGILDFIRNSNFFSILNKLAQHEYRTNPEISQIYGSELERYWMHRIHEADNNYHDGIREITTKAHNKYKEIFGGDRKGSKLKRHLLERARASKYDLVEVKYKDVMGKEKSAKFTQEEMGYIYSILRNEDMHENLSKINPNKSMGGMIKYNPETDTFDKTDLAIQMEKTLDPEMKEWVEFIGDMYDNDLYDRYNETYKKFFVFDMPKSRLFAPLFRVTKENAGQVIDEMLQQETYSSMGYNRHLKQRVSNSNPIKIMPVSDVFFSYINKMERFHSRADVLQEMNRFFKNPDIVDAIEESGGTMYTKAINQFLERYAGINTPGRITKDVDYIRRQVTRASLALKPTIFLKQLVSFPAYGAFLPTGQLTKGMAKFWLDPAKNWKMLSESSYILNRYDAGFDRDIADAMIKDYKSKKPIIDNWLNHAMFMVKWGDRMPIILGGYAVYDYNYNKFKKEGQTHGEAHKNAIREFELATRLTQQSSDIADLGYWQSQSSWSKLFTMYATAPLSYQRMVSGGVRMAISGAKGSNWKTFRKGVKTAFIGHVILPVLFQFAANGFELDDEEERRDLLWAAVLGNINNYFAIGDMVQTIIDDVIRKRPWGYQATPVASIVTDTKKGITEAISLIGDIIEGEDITVEDYMDAIEKIARPPSLGFGLPFPGMFRTLEGIVNAIEDDDATAAKKIKWILGYSKKGLESHDTDKTKSYTHN